MPPTYVTVYHTPSIVFSFGLARGWLGLLREHVLAVDESGYEIAE
jgi:hypothetical protein